MRKIINLVLFVIVLALVYVLYINIAEPIKFGNEKTRRQTIVVNHLKDIRTAQEHYRAITGSSFAPTFKHLVDTLTYGTFLEIKLSGDPDDPENPEITRDTVFISASDSIPKLGFDLANLENVPLSDGKKFEISADTLTYQKSLVNVVEVKTQWKNFMGKYATEKYKRYDDFYDPEAFMKFGDMNKPNISGNWER